MPADMLPDVLPDVPLEAVSAVALTLAFAVVAASTAPLLLLDDKCDILAASASFLELFDVAEPDIIGLNLYRLGQGEWDVPRLHALLDATLSGAVAVPVYEIDFHNPVTGKRRLVLNAHVLDYADSDGVKLLLSLADVTDARLAAKVRDDLAAEKVLLLQEIQHRVANSLQIIASVLMHSARKAGSTPETRVQLKDAHNRLMSVAALQRLLAESDLGDVDLGAYLGLLCQSLGASMIEDHDRIKLMSVSDDSRVSANASVSIGLVVTELVINALKHAFPGHRAGVVRVGYRARGANWTLTVDDNGIGMPKDHSAVAGLGTNIVNALARHLSAEVDVSDAGPGTCVALVHVDDADAGNDPVADEVAV